MTEKSQLATENNDNLAWAERSEFWQNYRPVIRGRPKKFHYREPLILCGHGVRVRVDRGTLLVQDGFTHFPQDIESRRYFPGDPDLPSRIIVLDADGGISFDALEWMSQQQIVLVQLNWRGDTVVVAGNSGYRADRKLVKAQYDAQQSQKKMTLARWLVAEKIAASISTIETALPDTPAREATLRNLKADYNEIRRLSAHATLSTLFGIEGSAARVYFRAWHSLPLRWKGLNRRPLPENWKTIGPRTMGWRKSPRNARHPINAMLNYGYGMLVSELRIQIAVTGLDPTIGVMHSDSYNAMPLVYDLMEPLRPLVDREILRLALGHTLTPGDFTINSVGGCRLNPQMARVVASHVSSIKSRGAVDGLLTRLRSVFRPNSARQTS